MVRDLYKEMKVFWPLEKKWRLGEDRGEDRGEERKTKTKKAMRNGRIGCF